MTTTLRPLARVVLDTLKGKTSPEDAAVVSAALASPDQASRPQSSGRANFRTCTMVSLLSVGWEPCLGQGVEARERRSPGGDSHITLGVMRRRSPVSATLLTLLLAGFTGISGA